MNQPATPSYPQPKRSESSSSQRPIIIHAKDVTTLTARLAQLLAEEVDLLSAMKVKDIEKLQNEKLFLIEALETHKKILKAHPGLSDTIPSQDKDELREVVAVFQDILAENHRRLQTAKEVNNQVVNAIKQVVAEKSMRPSYNNHGVNGRTAYQSMSVTLDQRI